MPTKEITRKLFEWEKVLKKAGDPKDDLERRQFAAIHAAVVRFMDDKIAYNKKIFQTDRVDETMIRENSANTNITIALPTV